MRLVGRTAALVLALVVVVPAPAAARGRAPVAALQVALRARGLYGATIDGYPGPHTGTAVRRFQRRAGLVVDGIAGPRTRRALGRLGRPALGARTLRTGRVGWDVSELQFLLAWHGFPSGSFDGGFGAHVEAAVVRFQRWARLGVDGIAGPATIRALRGPVPRLRRPLRRPVPYAVGDGFGPRGDGFHPGLDFPAPYGTAVRAARAGRVIYAGWSTGGYGNLVIVASRGSVTCWYGHLSVVSLRLGAGVRTGWLLGRVGSTGLSTGPHLHFEVRVRDAAVDPAPALR
jgi:peptidoglycan hydrolase-like protein with peptidoglycan-binding domain